ncbi:hypothetical protein [Streptomyces albidoflavus]|uniref:hypothetical protein n=1 Tax=Streptomyces albidoflavus TaxID=1886 RepID=UPI002E37EBA8|nr:hypothetical protein [Streptomyces albidoflavus]
MVEDRVGGTARADTAAQDLAGEVGGEGVARGDVLQGDGGGAVDPGEPGRARVDVGADLPALDEGVGVPGDDVALDAERARVTAAVDTPADVRAVDDADVGVAGDVLVPRVAAAEDVPPAVEPACVVMIPPLTSTYVSPTTLLARPPPPGPPSTMPWIVPPLTATCVSPVTTAPEDPPPSTCCRTRVARWPGSYVAGS